jgi:hypothetical protein
LKTLLAGLEFEEVKVGEIGGSRRRSVNSSGIVISLHELHPNKTLKRYQIEQVIEILRQEGPI